jgi:hypothetical protein
VNPNISSCAAARALRSQQAIAAIDEDRAVAIEPGGRVAEDLADWNVNRVADVNRVVFVRREYVDDLRGARREHRG